MRVFILCIGFSIPLFATSQHFVKTDTLREIPDWVSDVTNEKVNEVVTVDFSGDGSLDYLVQTQPGSDYWYNEYWVLADRKVLRIKRRYVGGSQYHWFVNLDGDKELELFVAAGYEDGIDYGFYNVDMNTGREDIIFFFNPIILEERGEFWGYPWDIHDIILETDRGSVTIRNSTDHTIYDEFANIQRPENQPIFPCIFFTGRTTQPQSKQDGFNSIGFNTIEEISKIAHSNY